jgi:hypothetical protein
VLFVSARAAQNLVAQLHHPSAAPKRAIDFRVFENRNVAIPAKLVENVAPAKNSMIAEGKAKYFDSDVPNRIADAIDALPLWKTQPETAADCAPIRQRLLDLVERVPRHFEIGMQKPKHVASRDGRAGIHLQSAAPSRRDNHFGQRLGD